MGAVRVALAVRVVRIVLGVGVRTVLGTVIAPAVQAAVALGPAVAVPTTPATGVRWGRSGWCARRTCWWST
ncbi:hypothetical protein [Streptomyces poriticola]|uniref:hypothetical protein n=1 Tax=Streptomyces poriticola TaxID=3120506 RepID=UPI002FCE3E91